MGSDEKIDWHVNKLWDPTEEKVLGVKVIGFVRQVTMCTLSSSTGVERFCGIAKAESFLHCG